MDGEREITITHTGNDVRAEYVKERECDPRDGTGVVKTTLDFTGTLRGKQLTGKANTCKYGSDNHAENGFALEDLELTVSDDGNTLDGRWFSSTFNEWRTATTITRKCPSGVEARLEVAQSQGPQQLLALCQQLLDEGVPADCLHPYADRVDCFGPGAHWIELQPATGPGPMGAALVLLERFVSFPGDVPDVPVLSRGRHRDPVLVTRETAAPLLFLLKKAEEIMRRTALYHNDLGDQVRVIDCVEAKYKELGWPTHWP
jgi:hypothetical protein